MPNPEYGLSYYYQWWRDFCEIDDISDGLSLKAIAVLDKNLRYGLKQINALVFSELFAVRPTL
jgi:hypothetical protein